MSGPAPHAGADLLADLDAVIPRPRLEYGGWRCAGRGGRAVTPWRGDARAAGAPAVGRDSELPPGTWPATAVRLARGRAGTQADLAAAWARLAADGILAVEGANAEGAEGWIRRLRGWCGDPVATAARAHRRAACFRKTGGDGPPPPPAQAVPADEESGSPLLAVPPGCFSGDGLDRGTAALLAHLPAVVPAGRVLDLGCGAGHLGLWCLRRWPRAEATLADADARAVAGALANADALGVAARCRGLWADQHDPLPGGHDLALLNPPAHAGNAVDLGAAMALCAAAAGALAPGGHLLVVANRRLPYEAPLARLGTVALASEREGFKVLAVRR